MSTPIATIDDIKNYAGIQKTNQDAVISLLLGPSLVAIGNFCNRHFPSAQVTEYRDGNDAANMTLVNYPVTLFKSLTINDTVIPQSTGANVAGWFVPLGGRRVTLRGYTFTRGNRNVVMTFNAGYGDADGLNGAALQPYPDDLKLAFIMYLVTRLNERERLGVGSKSLAGESVTYTDATSGTSGGSQGIPSAARIILESYINTIPETGL
jgi:hypothetical protein